jgi:hypothetical protein
MLSETFLDLLSEILKYKFSRNQTAKSTLQTSDFSQAYKFKKIRIESVTYLQTSRQ